MTQQWSEQQLDVFEWVAELRCHLAVRACAGSGKTTTVVEAVARSPQDCGMVTFTNSAQADLRRRVEERGAVARVLGCHKLGLSSLYSAWGDTVRVDTGKPYKVLRAWQERYHLGREARHVEGELVRLVSLAKANLERPGCDWGQLARRYGVQLWPSQHGQILDRCPELLQMHLTWLPTVDYDDMVSVPVGMPMRRRYRLLVVDEFQDLSKAQRALLQRAGRRLVLVGDPHQAIMQFAGADSDSCEQFCADLDQTRRGIDQLPLTTSWRCPESHVVLARSLGPDIQAAPGAEPGELDQDATIEHLVATARQQDPGNPAPVMALCRYNAPLIPLAQRLEREGVRCHIKGTAQGSGLRSLLRVLDPDTIGEVGPRVLGYLEQRAEELGGGPGVLGQLEVLWDRCQSLVALAEGCNSLGQLSVRIDSLDSEEPRDTQVSLSTVHRAKGLEARWVYVLASPSRAPRTDAQAERNVEYVAATRSSHYLGFIKATTGV